MNILADDNSDTVTIDPNKNYYEELVGDGKKFKTQEDLAKGKYEADHYIEILKRQKDELREDYMKMREEVMAKAKLEELIDQLNSKTKSQDDGNNKSQQETIKPFDPTEIDKMFDAKLNAYEINKRQKENLQSVKDKLIERFGSNYQSTVKQQIDALGITEEVFNTMAQNYPQMIFKTLDMDKPVKTENFPAPPRNMTTSLQQKGQTKRTWTYYQELKKKDPKLYHDPKIANQMQKDYLELGEAFEDGDFHA